MSTQVLYYTCHHSTRDAFLAKPRSALFFRLHSMSPPQKYQLNCHFCHLSLLPHVAKPIYSFHTLKPKPHVVTRSQDQQLSLIVNSIPSKRKLHQYFPQLPAMFHTTCSCICSLGHTNLHPYQATELIRPSMLLRSRNYHHFCKAGRCFAGRSSP